MKLRKDKNKKPKEDSLFDNDNGPKGEKKSLVRIKISKLGD